MLDPYIFRHSSGCHCTKEEMSREPKYENIKYPDITFLPCPEMFCMAGVPGVGAFTGPCIRGWKGMFFYIKNLVTCVLIILTASLTICKNFVSGTA